MNQVVLPTDNRKYLIVINNLSFLYSHFWNLAVAIREAGWELYVAANADVSPSRLIEHGMTFIALPRVGGTQAVGRMVVYLRALYRELRSLRPALTHFIYLETVLLGGIASRLAGVSNVIGAITGLGTLFAEDRLHYRLFRLMVAKGIRWGFNRPKAILAFENTDDRSYFVSHNAIAQEHTAIIPGAGVARHEMNAPASANQRPVIFFAGRMIRSKGAPDLVKACEEIYKKGVDLELWLAGKVDANNPTSLQFDELHTFEAMGCIKYLGYRSDVAELMQSADIFCLPTYYREGLPRVIIEACAAAKPVVTTDVPGCRDIVHNNVNGLLVQPRDHDALVRALETLLCDPHLRTTMGEQGRRIFEESYTVEAFLLAFDKCYAMLGVPLVLSTGPHPTAHSSASTY